MPESTPPMTRGYCDWCGQQCAFCNAREKARERLAEFLEGREDLWPRGYVGRMAIDDCQELADELLDAAYPHEEAE